MRIRSTLALMGLLIASLVHAENFTEANTDRAKALIDAAVEAHGGDAMMEDLRTLVVKTRTVNYSVDQSRGTEAPWDLSLIHI